MTSRRGYPGQQQAGSANTSGILKNFRQEDVVYALMTQLREKESEITMIMEQNQVAMLQQQIKEQTNNQTNNQLKSRIDIYNKTLSEKDTRIALLEQKLGQEKRGNGSAIAEANLKHLTETNAEYKSVLQERNDELSQLRPIMRELKAKLDEYEGKNAVQHALQLEAKLDEVKQELVKAKEDIITSNNTAEEAEKKVKGKEWMIKSLQDESHDQRSRENHLLSHIKKLDEKIDTYEKKFKGRGIDVPMLLAKLKDYEARTKDLQGQIRRLTNKKLNELVVRAHSPIPHQAEEKTKKASNTKPQPQPKQVVEDEVAENESDASDDNLSFLLNDSEGDASDEDATFASNETDPLMDPYTSKSTHDEDVLSDFISDVKVGIETLEMPSLCCAQRPSPVPMTSPTSTYASPQNSAVYEGTFR